MDDNGNFQSGPTISLSKAHLARAIAVLRAAVAPAGEVQPDSHEPTLLRLRVSGSDYLFQPMRLPRSHRLPQQSVKPRVHELWVLTSSSRSLRDYLRTINASYIDLRTGAVRVVAPGLFLDRTDLQVNVEKVVGFDPEIRNPFSDRGTLVVRALLERPKQTWSARQLAEATQVSPGFVTRVLHALRQEELVIFGRGRTVQVRVKNPWDLLQRWTAIYRWTDNPSLTVAAPVGSAARFLPDLAAALASVGRAPRWALTLQAGAAQLAKHAVWDRIHAYLDVRSVAAAHLLADRLGWAPSPSGKVVFLVPVYKQAVWQDVLTRHGFPIVHPVQLIVDLWHYPVRGREQAEHLARRELGWPPPTGVAT